MSIQARRGLISVSITAAKRQFTVLLTFTASRMIDTGVVLKSSAVAKSLPALIVVCRTARTAHWILIPWTLIITFTATPIRIICFADSKSRALHVKTRIYVYVEKKKGSIFCGFVFEGLLTNEPRSFLKGPKGGFPLSRDFYVRTRVNKIETMYERSRVSVKVEQGSTFTFTRDLPYIVSISFTRVYFTCVRTEKLRDSGSEP